MRASDGERIIIIIIIRAAVAPYYYDCSERAAVVRKVSRIALKYARRGQTRYRAKLSWMLCMVAL